MTASSRQAMQLPAPDRNTDPRRGDVAIATWMERGYLIAALSGALDLASAPALGDALVRLLGSAPCYLVIDLSAVSHVDVRGLAVLVGTGRRARMLGGLLRLAAPGPEVIDALTKTGLAKHFDIYPTVQAATADLPPE